MKKPIAIALPAKQSDEDKDDKKEHHEISPKDSAK